MELDKVEEMLDWLVEMDIQHYATEETIDYKPSGVSHFYLKRSLGRFTSEEMIRIFTNKMDDELAERWNNAVARATRK